MRVFESLLHITTLRPAADARSQHPPTAPNYDEAAATPFPDLPDALIFASGRPVRTAAQWRRRRAQITADFDREVYGRVPAGLPPVHWQVESLPAGEENGIPVVRKLLHGTVSQRGNPASPVTIQAVLTTPVGQPARVPVILELGFIGPDPYAPKLKDGEKGWQQQVLERGWGYAILDPRSVQADSGQGLTQGIVGLSLHGAPRAVADWGALRAWAWGASRVLDYLQADRSVDANRVAIEGLSRYGKARWWRWPTTSASRSHSSAPPGGRGEAAPAGLRRARGEPRGGEPVLLDGRQLPRSMRAR